MDFARELFYDPFQDESIDFHRSNSEFYLGFAASGGYENEFVEPVLPSQECPVCKLPMRDAVQTKDCGHRFCRGCLEQTLRATENSLCPTCRSFVDEEEGYYIDLAWSRDILSLLVKCLHHKDGCDWTGELRQIEEHKRNCLFEEMECNDCGEFHLKRNMVRHRLSECRLRTVQCHFCKERIAFIDLENHEDKFCKRFPLECANDCEHAEPIPREEMLYHLEITCPKTVIKCLYADVGCEFEGKRSSLSAHLSSSTEEHLKLTFSELFKTREVVDVIRKDHRCLLKSFTQLEEKNNALEKQILEMKQNKKERRRQYRHSQKASMHGEHFEH